MCWRSNWTSQLVQFISKIVTALTLYFGAHLVIEGQLTVGELIVFNMLAGRVAQPVLRLAQLWQDFHQARMSIARLGDILNFTGNVTDQNLFFQSGNNLQIDVMGTNNQTTIDGWFNSGNQASEIFTAGGLKLDSQISQLVQAMASYSGSNAGFDPTASNVHQIPNDTALQNTVAAAWHA
jgi:ABC-type multidrug transport system fused ATPase/permease subunit